MKAERKEVLKFIVLRYIQCYVLTSIFIHLFHYWIINPELTWVSFDASFNETMKMDVFLKNIIFDLLISIPISYLLLVIYCIHERNFILTKWYLNEKIAKEEVKKID